MLLFVVVVVVVIVIVIAIVVAIVVVVVVVVAVGGDGIVLAVVVADHELICIFTRYNCSSCNFHSSSWKNKWLSSLYLEINRRS